MEKLTDGYHVNVVYPCLIYCWSDAADYEYFIRFENEKDFTQEIIDCVDRELGYYGDPESTGNEEEYEYYFNIGYVEVVTNMLDGYGIEYKVFTEMEE